MRALPMLLLTVSALVHAQFLPPGWLNANAPFDTGDDIDVDHAIDEAGVIHAVWASQVPLVTGAGNDPDIYYARLEAGGWTQPELVNDYGLADNAVPQDERLPRILLVPDQPTVVAWQSTFPFVGSGTDWDIFASDFDGTSWTTRLVNDGLADSSPAVEDTLPRIIQSSHGALVVWQRAAPGEPVALFQSLRSTDWATPQRISTHPAGTQGDDFGPVALAATGGGRLYAAWSTNNPGVGLGNDRDIVFSTRAANEDWSDAEPVSNLALNDTGDDLNPTVALVPAPVGSEVHVAWSSNEDLAVAGGTTGSDLDIFAAVIGPVRTLPPLNDTYVVNSLALTDTADDVWPDLCAERGGVVHIAWQTEDSFIGDDDVLTSTNVTPGDGWEPFGLLGLNGLVDGPGADDQRPDLECGRFGLLSGAWQSSEPLFGLVGGDLDIFHALGTGRTIDRPEPVNNDAASDGLEDDHPAFVVDPSGINHAVWTREVGGDKDIYYASGFNLAWSVPEPVNPWAAIDAAEDNRPSIATDDAGRIYVVWDSNFDLRGRAGTDFDIMLRVLDNGVWSDAALVDSRALDDNADPLPDDAYAQAAINTRGALEVLWGSQMDLTALPNGLLRWTERPAPGAKGPASKSLQLTSTPVNLPYVDFVHGPDGASHLVYSAVDGSGPDSGIFHAVGVDGQWLAPSAVIAGGTSDGADDREPALLVNEFGVTVLWTSNREVATSGSDLDIWSARLRGLASWSEPALLHRSMATDVADDDEPIADARRGTSMVGWRFEDRSNPASDVDLAVLAFTGLPTPPLDAQVILANANGVIDTRDNTEIEVVALGEGSGFVVWPDFDDLGGTIGTDGDILHAFLGLPLERETIFRNGFEVGWVQLPRPGRISP